jgi:hypothetical protein
MADGTVVIDTKLDPEGAEKGANGLDSSLGKLKSTLLAIISIDAIKKLGTEMVEAAAQGKALDAQFSQTFGNMEGEATKVISSLGQEFGMLPSRLKGPMASMTSMFMGLGVDTESAMKMAAEATRQAADAAAYFDKPYSEAQAAIQSFLKGNLSAAESVGIFATANSLAAFAVEQGVIDEAKAFQNLDESIKMAVRVEYVTKMQNLANVSGQAAREADGWENVVGNLHAAWQLFLGKLGTPILEALIPIIQEITQKLVDMAEGLDVEAMVAGFKKFMDILGDILPYVEGLAVGFVAYKVVMLALEAPTLAVAAATAILELSLNPVAAIIAVVIGVITALIALYKHLTNASKETADEMEQDTNRQIKDTDRWKVHRLQSMLEVGAITSEQYSRMIAKMQEAAKAEEVTADSMNQSFGEISGGVIEMGNSTQQAADQVKQSMDSISSQSSSTSQKMASDMNMTAGNASSLANSFGSTSANVAQAMQTMSSGSGDSMLSLGQKLRAFIKGDMKGFESDMSGSLNGMPDKFNETGNNIAVGLGSGVIGGAPGVMDKIKELATNVLNTMKAALGINSPSRKMMGIGVFLPPGLSKGFDKALPKAEKDILSHLEGTMDRIATITPTYDSTVTRRIMNSYEFVGSDETTTHTTIVEVDGNAVGKAVDTYTRRRDLRVGV